MSLATWTRGALSSERRPLFRACWRAVEAQHRVSTMKLVDTMAEQSLLEAVIERTKPAIPAECRHLHYLLATPFRYGAVYPEGSRFRRAGLSAGVFYGSERASTAVAEMSFHRLLFFAESPQTPWPADAAEYTAFSVAVRTKSALDLLAPPLDADRALWTSRTDYTACHELADRARSADVEVLRYESARDPDPAGGVNLALLTCRAFASWEPDARQTWRIHLGRHGVRAICGFPEERLEFDRHAFASDPRVAALDWERARQQNAGRRR